MEFSIFNFNSKDASGNIVPGQRGHFTIEIEDGSFFLVSGYQGNSTLGYLCFHSERASMYHCGKLLYILIVSV